ncbi:DUF1120 domain-containing protein [Pseudomonas sp. SDO524_S393]
MSNSLKTLIAGLMFAASSTGFAASSVDLTVRGTITPSACSPSLGNSGSFDVGKVSAKDLKPDRPTNLGDFVTPFTLTCEAPTLIAIAAKDNRAGSHYSGEPSYFGLGLINGNEKLGGMSLLLDKVIADGVPRRGTDSLDGGTSWTYHDALGPNRITSFSDNATFAPIPVQSVTAEMMVTVTIAPANSLTLTEEVPIDGSGTLTMFYL